MAYRDKFRRESDACSSRPPPVALQRPWIESSMYRKPKPKLPEYRSAMAANLIEKLHPARFSDMSALMAAIVGYVLGESFTEPSIAELTVSEQENLVYTRQRTTDRGLR